MTGEVGGLKPTLLSAQTVIAGLDPATQGGRHLALKQRASGTVGPRVKPGGDEYKGRSTMCEWRSPPGEGRGEGLAAT